MLWKIMTLRWDLSFPSNRELFIGTRQLILVIKLQKIPKHHCVCMGFIPSPTSFSECVLMWLSTGKHVYVSILSVIAFVFLKLLAQITALFPALFGFTCSYCEVSRSARLFSKGSKWSEQNLELKARNSSLMCMWVCLTVCLCLCTCVYVWVCLFIQHSFHIRKPSPNLSQPYNHVIPM